MVNNVDYYELFNALLYYPQLMDVNI